VAIATSTAAASRAATLWSLAFRPFFLAAAIWAALALALWIVLFMTGGVLPSRFDPLSWHIHAMLFGFAPAAIAGFMLTAIPNWTGRPPVKGGQLAGLAGLWLLGRIACLVSAFLPLWLAGAIDLAFPVALCAVAAREVIAARNWRNLMMPIPIGVIAVADLLTYLDLAGYGVPAGLGAPPSLRSSPSSRRSAAGSFRLHQQLARDARRLGAPESSQCDRPCSTRDASHGSSRLPTAPPHFRRRLALGSC